MNRAVAENESAAAYAQADWSLTPALKLTFGLRYNVDWRRVTLRHARLVNETEVCRLDDSILDSPGECKATLPWRQFSYVPFTIGADYKTHGALLYAKVSRGFRAGGYNMDGDTPVGLLAYGPESVTSFEVGAKAELFAKRLRIDAAVYRANYDDIQVGEVIEDPVSPSGLTFVRQNGARARIAGGELEVAALLGRLRVTGALGITDGKYLELESLVLGLTDNAPLGLPKTTWSMAADLPIGRRGPVNIHLDYAWHSVDADEVFQSRCACSNDYGLLNGKIEIAFQAKRLQLALWGRNLTGTRYMAQWVDFGDYINDVPGDPRTYGVSASYRFQ